MAFLAFMLLNAGPWVKPRCEYLFTPSTHTRLTRLLFKSKKNCDSSQMLNLSRRMTQNVTRAARNDGSYEEALRALGNLQSNEVYIRSVRNSNYKRGRRTLEDVEKCLHRSGVTLAQLDALSVIHVAGTKGKGSTCAYVENILHKYGYRTGFFSSPHLVSVRERFRINKRPISETDFARSFWKLYNDLQKTRENEFDMPMYFKFLTILMFHVFLEAAVDVAIIEVGIGGELDCTNVIRNPVCVGITSLGLEHTSLLGDTIEEIAYQKAGTFKRNAFAFTVPQEKVAMEILEKRAREKECTLSVVPPLEHYKWRSALPISIPSDARAYNASLAIQLSLTWMMFHQFPSDNILRKPQNIENFENFAIDKIVMGLSSCVWPGRTQILPSSIADFYLDGAHTLESMQHCAAWFAESTLDKMTKRILIFNITGTRDSRKLLAILRPLNFHVAYFAPNIAGVSSVDASMNYQARENNKDLETCKKHAAIWGEGSIIRGNMNSVLDDIQRNHQLDKHDKPQVLVTGSLHLVGAVLAILDPHLKMTTDY